METTRDTMMLKFGKVYEVMRPHYARKYDWQLGYGRADIVDGQEVLVSAYDWEDSKPEIYLPLWKSRLTGRIFTDDELKGTGFGKLFPPTAELLEAKQ